MATIGNISLHTLFDWVSAIVLGSSILGSFLPPYEWFDRWPNFQAVYRIVTMTIARWGALNVKSLIYPAIASTANVNTTGGGAGDSVKTVTTEQKSVAPPAS